MKINQTKNKIKTRKERQKIKRKARKNTLKQKLLGLIFTVPLSQIYHNSIE